MANATLRYQEDLEEVISNIKSGKPLTGGVSHSVDYACARRRHQPFFSATGVTVHTPPYL
ncbi:MAG: hypothetical protein HEQ20_10400 [Aphanizomenon flos-aquae KM1D3_PB]|uniref:hypothetical protein n=1 Tax=Aphanizomenon flos-aquae TaxID=1176 RepID=UPI000A86F419|nr:hypothetical protein [Aphanizomenon flos-aquae]QSV71087.1 MAG: hypothetical protein HEQ20_10400 [Aphanizomenon flos-aquae KM1D3_PB]